MQTSEKSAGVLVPDSQANVSGNHFRAVCNRLDTELRKHCSWLSQAEINEHEDVALSEYLSHEKINFPGFMASIYGNSHSRMESLLD